MSVAFDVTVSPPAYSFSRVLELKAPGAQPNIKEFGAFLERDPVTVAHLLRQVNSPDKGLEQNVASLERAVTMLGFDAVCNTVLTEWYAEKSEGIYSESARNAYAYIVRTSIASGAIAKEIARAVAIDDGSTVVTCALLHQLGRLALLASDPTTYSSLWTTAESPMGEVVSLPPGIGRELVHYRTDYMRLGAEIASKWELPAELRQTIRYHADPEKADEPERLVVMAVAAAQMTARSLFEPASALDRDQSLSRVEKAYMQLARRADMLVADFKDFLSDIKPKAFERAQSAGLLPEETPQ